MATREETERARLAEQDALDRQTHPDERNRLGQYATPPELAGEIVEAVRGYWPTGRPVSFLDPCVGSGAFFSAVLSRFRAESFARAVGYEVDPRFAAAARRLWDTSGLSVIEGDFTTARPDGVFNLIVTNPPYVRHHHLSVADKRRLGEQTATIAGGRPSGLAGLYVYFPLLADAWLAEGGVAAWLVPAEFLDVNYGKALKRYLTRKVDLFRVHRFRPADVQFADALVSSAVIFYRKQSPSARPVAFTSGLSVLRPDRCREFDRDALREGEKWGPLFSAEVREAAPAGTAWTLGDLFTIRRGLATGSNDYFILPRAEAVRLGLPAEALRPILPGPRSVPGPIIEAAADGFPEVVPQMVLLDCRLGEPSIRETYPKLWDYLRRGHEAGVDRGYLVSRRTPWYSQEHRPPPPFLCPYMGRQRGERAPFRFLWNKSQATAHNVYMLLYPKGPLAWLLRDHPDRIGEVFAALNRIDTAAIRAGSRVYGGGLHKVEPGELAAIIAEPFRSLLGDPVSQRTGLFDACG